MIVGGNPGPNHAAAVINLLSALPSPSVALQKKKKKLHTHTHTQA